MKWGKERNVGGLGSVLLDCIENRGEAEMMEKTAQKCVPDALLNCMHLAMHQIVEHVELVRNVLSDFRSLSVLLELFVKTKAVHRGDERNHIIHQLAEVVLRSSLAHE